MFGNFICCKTGKEYHDNKLVYGPARIIVQSISGLGNLEWPAATMRTDCAILGAIVVRTKEEGERSFLKVRVFEGCLSLDPQVRDGVDPAEFLGSDMTCRKLAFPASSLGILRRAFNQNPDNR